MTRVIAYLAQKTLLVNLSSAMLLVAGLYAAWSIQREAFPAINFDVLMINASYLGASPREVESRLLIPIEREIRNIDGIRSTRATAYPGSMQMLIEIDPGYADRARLASEVQQAMERADLPADLPADPLITEVKSEQMPVLSFSVFGDLDRLALKRIGDRIEDDVRAIPGVANVLVQGEQKEEIRIVLDPERMRRHRVSIQDIAQLVRGWNVTAPGGRLPDDDGQRVIRLVGEFTSAQDAAELVIRATDRGDTLRLGDVATVTETLERPRRYVAAQGQNAVNMIVLKQGGDDLLDLVDRIRAYLATVPGAYGEGIGIEIYGDFSTVTHLRLGVLSSNGVLGLALLLGVLLIGLRPSIAVSTAWGLPIIFFAGLAVLYAGGITLNLLTMFAFILVIGLIVDNGIIIGENVGWHLERGMSPAQAAVAGTAELVAPITTTVLTSVIAFVPLLFMEGIIGKFVAVMPLVVITLLLFSWLEALLALPNHIRITATKHARPRSRTLYERCATVYGVVLRHAVRWRYLTVALTLIALCGSVFVATQMRFQLFPSGAESQFYLRVSMPPSTSLERTRDALLELEREVRVRIDPAVLETTTLIAGENSADQREAVKQVGDRFGFVRVVLTPFTERTVSVHEVMDAIRPRYPRCFQPWRSVFPWKPWGRRWGVRCRSRSSAVTRTRNSAPPASGRILSGIAGVTRGERSRGRRSRAAHRARPRSRELRGVDLATVADRFAPPLTVCRCPH